MSTQPDPQRSPAAQTAVPTVVRQARWSLLILFGLMGLTFSSWLTRLPSLREDLGIDSARLGTLLIFGAVGALISVLIGGTVVTRYGSRAVMYAATAGNVVGFGLIAAGAVTGSVGLFVAGAFLNGFSGAGTNIPINLNAAIVEQRVGRAILPHFHAAFSIGAAIGTVTGAAFSFAHVSAATHIVVIAVVVAGLRIALIPAASALQPPPMRDGSGDPRDGSSAGDPGSAPSTGPRRRGAALRTALAAWTEPRTLLIGLVILAASLSEGSAGNWLSIAVVDGFHEQEAVGSLAYGTFIVAMTVFRMLGTRVIDRFGRVAVLRASAVVSLLGLVLFALGPSLWVAWIGIVAWGFGAALGNPIAIAAASDDPTRAAARVSVVTSFSSMAQLAAPPVLGLLVASIGGRYALLTIALALVMSIVLAGQVAPLRRQDAQSPAATDREPAAPTR
ncbi:MFS transporter [Paraoerskovia sediminicola]|uniref:MFS transporter n=1 Tax=Paraoerskovia sediminicola TaxID=1138587 RepID=A0ABN6XEP5_9CELL|nr:MFS transporter [Paraoerskovia sediminicola]BDZ42167.1 MFS transporter [Paraoerskovia sediminicola]